MGFIISDLWYCFLSLSILLSVDTSATGPIFAA